MLVLCCNDYHTHTSYDFFKHLPCAFQNKKDFTRQKTCVFKKAVGIKVNSGTSLRLSRVIVMTPSASQQVHKQALVFEHTVVAGFYDILGSFFSHARLQCNGSTPFICYQVPKSLDHIGYLTLWPLDILSFAGHPMTRRIQRFIFGHFMIVVSFIL